VDVILEQLSAFWANTELVLDVLTKKGQHVEKLISVSLGIGIIEGGYLSRLSATNFMWSSALDRSGVLLSYSMVSLA